MKYLQNVFQGRSFLDCKDYTPAEIEYLIDFALHLKELKKEHIPHEYLKGKNIALLFEKSSTRTRSAFAVASMIESGNQVAITHGNGPHLYF